MTMSSVRGEFVAALNSVSGINASTWQPPASGMGAGAAWPEWLGMEQYENYPLPTGAINNWRVVVIVGSTDRPEDAVNKIDAFLSAGLLEALRPVAVAESVQSRRFSTDAGDLACVEITLRREP